MPRIPGTKRPVGRQVATPPRSAKTPEPATTPTGPPEPDRSAPATSAAPDAVMVQAKRDIDAGLVDTDMRATPGLDAAQRARLVPGAGGKPPSTDA